MSPLARRVPLVGSPVGATPQQLDSAVGAYANTVANDNPLAWWRLNELVGTSAADSGQAPAAAGTYTGTVLLGRLGIDYATSGGTSVFFGSSGSYVTVGALPAKLQLPTGTDFSLEGWAWIGSGDTPGPAIITEAFAGDGTVRYMLGFGAGGTGGALPTFGWYNGGWRQATGTVALNDGRWHHIVGTYEAAANLQRLYVDGVQVASNTPSGSQPVGSETLYLGRRWDSTASVNAFLDEIAVYGYRLSGQQIGQHYAALQEGTAQELRATEVRVEAVVQDTTPELRVTEVRVETVVKDTTPELRVTEVVVEAVVKQWAHYFGILGDTNDDVLDAVYVVLGSGSPATSHTAARERVSGGVVSGTNYRKTVQYRNNSQYRG